MEPTSTHHGIPDIELEGFGGGLVNPANFIGHELVVLFCALDQEASRRDMAEYALHMEELSDSDAWLIAICDDEATACEQGTLSIAMAQDPERAAWDLFLDLLEPGERASRTDGAVYLFGRGGALRASWRGPGHASDVARAVKERR